MDMMDITKRQAVIDGAQNPKFEKFLTEKVKNVRNIQNVIEIWLESPTFLQNLKDSLRNLQMLSKC